MRGDIAEAGETAGQALRDLLGLVVRRQAEAWRDWRPWLAFLGVIPVGCLLSAAAGSAADHCALYSWLYTNYGDIAFLTKPSFRADLIQLVSHSSLSVLALAAGAWASGFALSRLSGRAIPVAATLYCSLLLLFASPATHPLLRGWFHIGRARDFAPNAAVFEGALFRVGFPVIAQAAFVLAPALWGMYRGARNNTEVLN